MNRGGEQCCHGQEETQDIYGFSDCILFLFKGIKLR